MSERQTNRYELYEEKIVFLFEMSLVPHKAKDSPALMMLSDAPRICSRKKLEQHLAPARY